MKTNDFSTPQRMSPGALFIIFTNYFVRIFVPLATITVINLISTHSYGKASIGELILLSSGVCIGLPFIMACVYYFPKKFCIKDGNLVFINGLINRENTSVPFDRVHSLRTKRGIFYRMLDMRGIVFDTIATKQQEIELILDEYVWQDLLSVIDNEDQSVQQSSREHQESDTTTFHFPIKNILAGALCQNHLKGMAVLGSFVAIIISNFDNLSDETTDSLTSYLNSCIENIISSPLNVILALGIIYIGILLLWLGKILLQYFDMRMDYNKSLITFTYGMLTRSSCRFFYNKICTVWIKRNFLEKKFGLSTLMLKQALFASVEKEDDKMKLYGTDKSTFFLKWWLGEDYEKSEEIISAKSGRGVFIRFILIRLFLTVVISIILSQCQLSDWLIIVPFYLVFAVVKGICLQYHSKIILHSSYFIIHNGAFAEISNYIKYTNIQVIDISRSPLTKIFHRVSLTISTSGTSFTVRSIKEDVARKIYELLLHKALETSCKSS